MPKSQGLPFRAEHVGSLLRTPELLRARDDKAKGRIDDAALKLAEDKAIREVVKLQEDIGFRSITDGEYRRAGFNTAFYSEGLGIRVTRDKKASWDYANKQGQSFAASVPHVEGRVAWTRPINVEAFEFLKSVTRKGVAKITMPSPVHLHFLGGRDSISRDSYPDLDLFWSDIIDAFRKELAALADAGCTYVQIDETSIVKMSDPKIRDTLAKRGDDWQELASTYADVINASISEVSSRMTIGMHVCRGNLRGFWHAEGGYDLVSRTLFQGIDIDIYFLEYDSPRAGDFSPLAILPEGKSVVLGLLSTKDSGLEPAAAIRDRIEDAARFVPIERLALSPQCGFASVAEGNDISFDQQVAKLRQIVEIAHDVWGE